MRLKAGLALVAATCAVVVLAGPALGTTSVPCQSGPGPAGSGGVNVYQAGGAVMWCSPSIIKQNSDIPPGTQFPMHGAPPITLTKAISIHRLLTAAGVDLTMVTAVQISHDFGAWSVLRRPGLRDPSTSNGLVPIVETQGSTTTYLRPMRNPNDNNPSDAYNAKNGAAIDIYVEGPRLIVSCAVLQNTSSTTPGKPVTFQASVQNPGVGGGPLTYRWFFGDGESRIGGTSVKHSFAQVGSNPFVYVWVRGGNGAAGVCDAQQVTVRSKANVPPVRSGANNGNHNNGGSNNSGGVGVGGNSGNTNTNTNTDTTPTTAGTNPSQGNQNTPTTGSNTTPTQSHPPRTSPIRSGAQAHHGGTLVTGRLISAVTPVSPTQLAGGNVPPSTPFNQRVAPAAAIDNGSVKPVAGIVGACAIVLLLLSGAGREVRSLRRSIASARLG